MGATENRTELFADDIIFSSNPKLNIPEIQKIFTEFSRFSGLCINFAKRDDLPLTAQAKVPWIQQTQFIIAKSYIA